VALLDRGLQPAADRGAHSRDGGKIEGLLDGAPIGLRHEHGRVALACDLNRFVRVGDRIQQRVEESGTLLTEWTYFEFARSMAATFALDSPRRNPGRC